MHTNEREPELRPWSPCLRLRRNSRLTVWSSGVCVRSERQVWCEVKDLSGELLIRVLDPATARSVVSEVHDTVAAVVGRAVQLQHQFSAAGWELVDFDLDELE